MQTSVINNGTRLQENSLNYPQFGASPTDSLHLKIWTKCRRGVPKFSFQQLQHFPHYYSDSSRVNKSLYYSTIPLSLYITKSALLVELQLVEVNELEQREICQKVKLKLRVRVRSGAVEILLNQDLEKMRKLGFWA